jgi:hypothetical protein
MKDRFVPIAAGREAPDRQHVVPGAEHLLGPEFHAERIDEWQRPQVGLHRPLEEQFLAQSLRRLEGGSVLRERQVRELIEARGGCAIFRSNRYARDSCLQ